MNPGVPAASLGIISGLAVAVVVTELLQPIVFFTLFVGIPAGIAAGIAVAAATLMLLMRRRHREAT